MSQERPFSLAIDGVRGVEVHVLRGTEKMSEAWRFDVTVTAPLGEDVDVGALGQRATLLFNLGPKPRAFYGVIAAARIEEHHEERIKYVVRVVPRLWLLKRKKRSRIFQNMRIPDIVSAVLLEAGIATRWQLTRAYPAREYCVQYEETDYAFMRRILAEAGIWFYFFTGGPISSGAFMADEVEGAVASVGSSVASMVGGSAMGGLVGAAAQMGETLIPGDTVIGADDEATYPPVGGDDPAALAAATAAAMAPAIGDVLGAGGGIAGAAIGAASSVAGTVIADVVDASQAAPLLHFLRSESARVTREDKVSRFTLRNKVRSSASTFRTFDPDRPTVKLQSTAVSTKPFPPSPFEIAAEAAAAAENAASAVAAVAAVAGAPALVAGALGEVSSAIATADSIANEVGVALGQKIPFEVYEHHDPLLFPKWAFASDQAPRILRQARRRVSIAEGESGCTAFSPGHRFELSDHPVAQLDAMYVLTEVEHRGERMPGGGGAWKVYVNTFACAPASMPYPPKLPKRESVQVMLTATVVGPPGEEICVDAKGQVKVQFHWDREGVYDDKSSCWIRVMQPWAGAAWGHQFIPRVGMEVVVTFEGGDPDKPMVIGAVPNGTHPLPFILPDDKTRSGWRTQSSPGGGGYNELSFEDAADNEQIRLIAQRDLDETVNNNHTRSVTHNERVSVGRNRTLTVGGALNEVVEKSATHTVKGARAVNVEGTENKKVTGDTTTVAKGQMTVMVQGVYGLTVGTTDADATAFTDVHGDYKLGASKTVRLVATQALQIVCGESIIEVKPDEIRLEAKALTLVGKKSVSVEGKGPALSLTDEAILSSKTLTLKGSQGLLKLDSNAEIQGTQIKLGKPGTNTSDPDAASADTKSFRVNVHDDFDKPLANKPYRLLVEGKELDGTTDGDGLVEQDVSPSAASAHLTVWLAEKGQDPKVEWQISLADLPPVDTPQGVRRRLQNLGYYRVGTGQSDADADAIRAFQKDQGTDVTGILDDALKSALDGLQGG